MIAVHTHRRMAVLVAFAFTAIALAREPVGAPVRIPLVEGTIYTGAAAFPAGDEEHIVTLTSLDAQTATFNVASRTLDRPVSERLSWSRSVRRQDLADSRRINNIFQTGDPEQFPASTFMHLSATALEELKSKGETAMVLGTIKDFPGMRSSTLFAAVPIGRKYFRGKLKRVGAGTVPIAVLVNGERVDLPAVEAAGRFSVGGDTFDVRYWWLDDPLNALCLRRIQGSNSGQIVRIDLPGSVPQSAVLARELAGGDCRANLSGVYFDTASAQLLPQSNAALDTVAKLLRDNPAWNLTIEGHTDNVGKASYNFDLSNRRAAAVRAALLARPEIDTGRLKSAGFGMTRPIASNATLDGRATNRRVEVARVCP